MVIGNDGTGLCVKIMQTMDGKNIRKFWIFEDDGICLCVKIIKFYGQWKPNLVIQINTQARYLQVEC